MTWYVDTSAFIKLVREEDQTEAFTRWVSARDVCSSDLLRTEARRAVTEDASATRLLLEGMLRRTTLIRLTPDLFDVAGELRTTASLRSLDAIHLAAARRLGRDLEGIATYDRRMAAAAAELGHAVAAPAP
jgi:predicted nucleic acid-binding protein